MRMGKYTEAPSLLYSIALKVDESDDEIRRHEYQARSEAAWYKCATVIRKVEVDPEPFDGKYFMVVEWYGK